MEAPHNPNTLVNSKVTPSDRIRLRRELHNIPQPWATSVPAAVPLDGRVANVQESKAVKEEDFEVDVKAPQALHMGTGGGSRASGVPRRPSAPSAPSTAPVSVASGSPHTASTHAGRQQKPRVTLGDQQRASSLANLLDRRANGLCCGPDCSGQFACTQGTAVDRPSDGLEVLLDPDARLCWPGSGGANAPQGSSPAQRWWAKSDAHASLLARCRKEDNAMSGVARRAPWVHFRHCGWARAPFPPATWESAVSSCHPVGLLCSFLRGALILYRAPSRPRPEEKALKLYGRTTRADRHPPPAPSALSGRPSTACNAVSKLPRRRNRKVWKLRRNRLRRVQAYGPSRVRGL
ncbi:hypothetical protein EJ04DRAFT_595599 [Polyplosphaeria fusca]|uniref:Uncharacterized protein n=1 Tax=Polyplosphaeria fusca TaxID=682080 RepID=A0A9P4V5W9_9PLEO|nr:hypothetical protein EJ04DRAFT_595599 [Polyplosphaeria fusca]